MSFLTPLFLLGLAGLAVPVIIHLIQRERKNVVQFPSLMFLQRIPYQSVQRRRIRNWPLLLLRLAALALIVAAFARPFFRRTPLAAAGVSGAREVVILIDNSYSMGYGDRWSRATTAAREAIGQVGPSDRATIVFFSNDAEVVLKSTPDRSRLNAAVSTGKPSSGATRYGPALKLAGSLISESRLPRREVILISDFQRTGWQGAEGVRLPDGVALTPRPITDAETSNLSVTPVSLQRATFSEQDRVTVTGGITNHSAAAAPNVEMTLEVDGRPVQTEHVSVEPNSSASITFAPFTPAARNTRGTVRIGADKLPLDNAFNFTVSPKEALRIIIAERPGAPRDVSLYLSRALALGETPPFDISARSIDSITNDDLQRASVVILNDAPVAQLTAERLSAFVARGGGLLVALGTRATWPTGTGAIDILGGMPGQPIDRSAGQAGRLGALEYGDPIFEPFRAPRSGDFSGARFYSYRSVTLSKDAQILARFDDGTPALVGRRVGNGRVLVWTSSLDLAGNDLPLKSVFLPFVHRMVTTLASYTERPSWMTVGDVLEAGRTAAIPGAQRQIQPRVVLTPSGERVTLDGEGPDVLELDEQGFYEVRGQGREALPPMTVASNVDLAESDLTPMDPQEVVAGALGRAGSAVPPGTNAVTTDLEQERNQRVWWYLLFAGVVILGLETLIGNRISRQGPVQV
jgi:Aerotolerance regulator N-terminal/von Willebrand factor type A domain